MNKKLKLDELGRVTNEEFKQQKKNNITVVLDNIRSANNVGSVFRTSDAFNIEKIHLCGVTAKPPHKDIQKTALGATDSVEWKYHKSTQSIIETLKNDGYKIVSVEQAEKTISLLDFKISTSEKIAIVMGNEVKGVQQDVINLSDIVLEIPQWGTKHSLNVSVCTGIILWELVKQLNA